MLETYLSQGDYNATVATLVRFRELLAIEPNAITGTVTDNEVKIALGERLNVWPDCIRELAESDKADAVAFSQQPKTRIRN